jgi:thioredoxin 1
MAVPSEERQRDPGRVDERIASRPEEKRSMEKIGQAGLEAKLRSAPFVLLDFSSPGCAPCKKIAQALPALLEELRPADVAAFEVDIASDAAVAARFFVLGVPTLILFREGNELARFSSLPKADTIRRFLS